MAGGKRSSIAAQDRTDCGEGHDGLDVGGGVIVATVEVETR